MTPRGVVYNKKYWLSARYLHVRMGLGRGWSYYMGKTLPCPRCVFRIVLVPFVTIANFIDRRIHHG